MKKNQKPYHIEAAELGVRDFIEIKKIKINIPADKLRSIWDYRAAGLKIDQAREYLRRWNTKSYHPRDYPPETGRISSMLHHARMVQKIVDDKKNTYSVMPDGELSYARPKIGWIVNGRTIITSRIEDVTWSDNKRHHWPESSSVSYESILIRTDRPGTIEAYHQKTDLTAERKIIHNLRGNWRKRVCDEFGLDYAAYQESVRIKSIAGAWEDIVLETAREMPQVAFKSVAFFRGRFRSIYDGSEYQIGETRAEPILGDHDGGFYVRESAPAAFNAFVPENSQLINSRRVVLRCLVWGRNHDYRQKRAYENIKPLGIAR